MAAAQSPLSDTSLPVVRAGPRFDQLSRVPWWLLAIILLIAIYGITLTFDKNYSDAFDYIKEGITLTVVISLEAYAISIILGLIAGFLRVSPNVILNNIGTFYVELIRGIPMLPLIVTIGFVVVPAVVDQLNSLGVALESFGIRTTLADVSIRDLPLIYRAIIALAITYGAFLAEIFRAGIESIGKGQMEAARSLGMGYGQAMRYVILPQAVRNVLPALANDFVSMVKDSSLVSALGVQEMTQLAKKYTAASFRYPEGYAALSILYLIMVVTLSLMIRIWERRLRSRG